MPSSLKGVKERFLMYAYVVNEQYNFAQVHIIRCDYAQMHSAIANVH